MENSDQNSDEVELCSFWLEDKLFGIDILDVKEISVVRNITPVFHSSQDVKGLVNLRGQIHLVIDLRMFFNMDALDNRDEHKLIIFKDHIADPFGILVDRIGDVVKTKRSNIEERRKRSAEDVNGENRKSARMVTKGVCKLKDNLMIILDPAKVVTREEVEVG
ncbi:MAG: purine-binding chemotaxis protein CheW [Planctomycetes bacterium]|nr:purine-binding chemotaxis protein CheW [Planctomycetota bacterium]